MHFVNDCLFGLNEIALDFLVTSNAVPHKMRIFCISIKKNYNNS